MTKMSNILCFIDRHMAVIFLQNFTASFFDTPLYSTKRSLHEKSHFSNFSQNSINFF